MAKNSGTTSGPIDWEYADMLLHYSNMLGGGRIMSLEQFEGYYWKLKRGRAVSAVASSSEA